METRKQIKAKRRWQDYVKKRNINSQPPSYQKTETVDIIKQSHTRVDGKTTQKLYKSGTKAVTRTLKKPQRGLAQPYPESKKYKKPNNGNKSKIEKKVSKETTQKESAPKIKTQE